MRKTSFICAILAAASAVFGGVGVTRKQLNRTVTEINSNMASMVTAEIGRNVDGYIDQIGREAAAAATNYLPSFIAGLGEFAEASKFTLTEFTTNSLTFNDTFISNGVFVSVERKAYFRAEWVSPTNKGFRVNSSSYPGIPAGTLFAIDETPVESGEHPTAIINQTGLPENEGRHTWRKYQLYCADLFSQPLDLLWYEGRWESGTVEVDRRISEQKLYHMVLSISGSTAYQTAYDMTVVRNYGTTSPGWVSPQSGETHIVTLSDQGGIFRMGVVDSLDDSIILGSFTLVPTCLTDAEADAARNGTPKLSAGSRFLRFLKRLLVPDARAAVRHPEIFSANSGLPQFRITWTTADGSETLGVTYFSINKRPRQTKVNNKGEEDFSDEMYVPFPWYTRADWRIVENWISFPAQYQIYYEDALGAFQTKNGTRYGISNRTMNNASFKVIFLGCTDMLDSLYVYPQLVEKKDPCKEGRHSYIHCVCSVCGDRRSHSYEETAIGCYRCLNEESVFSVDGNNEIVEDPNSRSACGHIPDAERYHVGWHGVGEEVDDKGNRRYCGCACGHYTDNNDRYYPLGYEGIRRKRGLLHLTLDHVFPDGPEDAEWIAGDEDGNNTENVHHGTVNCSREGCDTTHVIVENHDFYDENGNFYNCIVEGIPEEDGGDNYHLVKGECKKCAEPTETVDLHRRQMPDEGDGAIPCMCIGGVQFDTEGCGEVHHHYVVTACGEIRCLYCLSYSEDSPRLDPSEHTGVQPPGYTAGQEILLANEEFPVDGSEPATGHILRVRKPNEEGHPCGCGLVMLKHNFQKDPDTGIYHCPDVKPPNFEEYWWAAEGCGYTKADPEEDGGGKYDLDITHQERPDPYNLNTRRRRGGGFTWDPDDPDNNNNPRPTPNDLWPDDSNRPPTIPPDWCGDLVPTVVDFTYVTPMSVEWTEHWEWGDDGWKKEGVSFWGSLLWLLQNSPIIPTFR